MNVANYSAPSPGVQEVSLRGYAYGANFGWVSFEERGNPRVNLVSGKLRGQIWSANTGWIDLGDLDPLVRLATDTVRPGVDSDTDGIADAYEFLHAKNLDSMNAQTDADGDGMRDVAEYAAATDPFDPADRLRIIETKFGAPGFIDLTFTSRPGRVYFLEESPDLQSAAWVGLGGPVWAQGVTTGVSFEVTPGYRSFWRISAELPLQR